MSKKVQRQNELVRIIEAQGMLPVKTIASMLNVSEMTVRRDIEALGEESGSVLNEYNLLQALENSNEQKDRIGKKAASLIEPNDVIIIDTGSTTARILPYVPADKNLTVVCYNANVLMELRYKPGIRLLFCGGVYHPNTEMFESPEGIQFIERTRANKVFLSAAGVHAELGVTCANSHEVPTKNAVIKSSSERILVADSDKFGQVKSSYFCELDDVGTVVTDKNLSQEWEEFLKQKGIQVHLV